MNPRMRKKWNELMNIISEIQEEDTSEIIFYKLKDWYHKNKKIFTSSLVERYRLEQLINVDINNYPVEESECTLQIIKNLLHINPSKEESMLSPFESKLWELIVLRTDDRCHRCNSLGMSPIFDTEAEKVVLECTVCGSTQTLEGKPHESLTPTTWRLATNKDLKLAGLI